MPCTEPVVSTWPIVLPEEGLPKVTEWWVKGATSSGTDVVTYTAATPTPTASTIEVFVSEYWSFKVSLQDLLLLFFILFPPAFCSGSVFASGCTFGFHIRLFPGACGFSFISWPIIFSWPLMTTLNISPASHLVLHYTRRGNQTPRLRVTIGVC